MLERYILASDLGSGSCKTVILDATGRVVSSAGAEYPTFYPQPGWVEQHPADWYQAFAQTTRRAISQAGIPASEIGRVGLVAVTHNAVLLDEHERPLRPCILTFDQRSSPQCRQIERSMRSARCGPGPNYAGSKNMSRRCGGPPVASCFKRITSAIAWPPLM
jgi:xylulokinase